MSIAIIDYGMGNLGSLKNALLECGADPVITSDLNVLLNSEKLILPGVGAFPEGMKNLHNLNLVSLLNDLVKEKKRPILGICLGMQLLAKWGNELGKTEGLGFLKGEVKKLETNSNERIPHVGWNEIKILKESFLLDDIPNNSDFYFVHSFHFKSETRREVIAHTPYCGFFDSIVVNENIMGVQFHPEKSSKVGFKLLKNFINKC